MDKFHLLVGKTILECQRIEHDIKLIYAGMLKGDFEENRYDVNNQTLGTVVIALEELDNSDGRPYFSQEDYKLLKDITRVRNWLVHRSYADFMYTNEYEWEQKFKKCYKKLRDFNERMEHLGDQVEAVRIEALRRYGRI
ncbi:MAG: hypothetical protein IKD35_02425 [Clostridia bacterium]|nr:hypothetical protein [Clostridia bacterium]